ncbi:GNAT family N-acetyltransferase [Bacillus halotolerans]|uniref:GNAT family N-acetyltransferase n=1 Tax=Bacillus halotolerans TaxID=260554 RepID=UPI0020C2F8C5|nr:GNAT family N-acetyltransferase [Bacillus halotolerans]UTL74673.1 GNAT family N-acetyltransferase [Bacillus halotolerans]
MLTVANEAKKPYKSLKEPAWYLEVLGVSPSYQGKSLGSKMINDCLILFISKSGGGTLALITNTDLNRSFYKKERLYLVNPVSGDLILKFIIGALKEKSFKHIIRFLF